MSRKDKLKAPFYGVSDVGEEVACPYRLERGISSPPSYMAQLALGTIGGFSQYGPEDKVAWAFYISYKGINFEVRDWKRSSWTIEANEGTPGAIAAGQELRRKVEAVARNLDKVLAESLKQKARETEFALNNSYPKIRATYEYFREKAKAASSEIEGEAPSSSQNALLYSGAAGVLNSWLKKDTERVLNAYAMVAFYYSAMEVLFDVLYTVGDRREDFWSFRELTWRERFVTVLPVEDKPVLERIYSRLLSCKRNFRDQILHGMGGEANVLVHHTDVGLVPISYEYLTQSAHYTAVSKDVRLANEAIQAFDDFDSYLEKDARLSRCLAYAKSGMIIPFYGEQLRTLKQALDSPADFQEWLHDEEDYSDYLDEQF